MNDINKDLDEFFEMIDGKKEFPPSDTKIDFLPYGDLVTFSDGTQIYLNSLDRF